MFGFSFNFKLSNCVKNCDNSPKLTPGEAQFSKLSENFFLRPHTPTTPLHVLYQVTHSPCRDKIGVVKINKVENADSIFFAPRFMDPYKGPERRNNEG